MVEVKSLAKKVTVFLFLIPLFFISCQAPFPFFERDYHLIVTEGDTLLQYLPDTLGWIDTIYGYEGGDEYYYMTDVGEGQAVLKSQLGSAIGNVILDRGEPVFSLHCPSDIGPEETDVYVKITTEDANVVFGRYFIDIDDTTLGFNINSFFSYDKNDIENDTLYEHGIPTQIQRIANGFGIICESNSNTRIKIY